MSFAQTHLRIIARRQLRDELVCVGGLGSDNDLLHSRVVFAIRDVLFDARREKGGFLRITETAHHRNLLLILACLQRLL